MIEAFGREKFYAGAAHFPTQKMGKLQTPEFHQLFPAPLTFLLFSFRFLSSSRHLKGMAFRNGSLHGTLLQFVK